MTNSFKEYRKSAGKKRYNHIKYLTEDNREIYLYSNILVEKAPTGIPVHLTKVNSTGRAEEDWIVEYKNRKIFPNEFNFTSNTMIRKNSISTSQIKLIWEHLKKLNKVDLPNNTELLVDFVVRTIKNTPENLYDMTLIESNIDAKDVSDKMSFKLPEVIFEGAVNEFEFASGIKNSDLKSKYRNIDISWDDNGRTILETTKLFTDVCSNIVIKSAGNIISKSQFLHESTVPDAPADILEQAEKIIRTGVKTKSLEESVNNLSDKLAVLSEKAVYTQSNLELIQETARILLNKKFSSSILIISKFKNINEEAISTIKEAIIKNKNVTLNVVSSTDTKGTKKERNNILENLFPDINIINNSITDVNILIEKTHQDISDILYIDMDEDEHSNKPIGVQIEYKASI